MKWKVVWNRRGVLHYARDLIEEDSPVVPIPMACGLWPKSGEQAQTEMWSPHYTWKEILSIHHDEGAEPCPGCLAAAQLEELTR